MATQEKYALCMGAFASCADRFVTGGYHRELSFEEMLDMAASVEGVQGVEMDYPFMPPIGTDVKALAKMVEKTGLTVCTLEVDHYGDAKWKFGALTSEDEALRREAIELSKHGMDAAMELGANQVNLWLGHDGYDYPMEAVSYTHLRAHET